MKSYSGQWRITEMDLWDSEYLDMDVPAYIQIENTGSGEFQFGLVSGQIDGDIVKDGDHERFDFTWEGNDECDEASGSGWLKLKGKTALTGQIKFHHGDRSGLVAERMK
jgi:hypothetical protein